MRTGTEYINVGFEQHLLEASVFQERVLFEDW